MIQSLHQNATYHQLIRSRKINSPICGLSPSGSSPSYRPACGLVSDRLPFRLPSTFSRDHNLIRWISHAHHHALRLGQRRKTSLPQHGKGSEHRVSHLQYSRTTFATSADFRFEQVHLRRRRVRPEAAFHHGQRDYRRVSGSGIAVGALVASCW